MRKLIGCSTFVLALFSVTPELTAQEVGPQQGQRSISFGVRGEGSSTFGLWTMLSERTNLGLLGTLNYNRQTLDPGDRKATSWTLTVAPTLRSYTARLGPVLPYLQGGIGVGFGEGSPNDVSILSASANGGLGVEWFPVSNVGIGGYTGLGLSYQRTRTGPSDFRTTTKNFGFGSMTSGLSIQLYFGGKQASTPVAAAQ